MNFIDVDRGMKPIPAGALGHPRFVAPDVPFGNDLRSRTWTQLVKTGVGVGLDEYFPAGAVADLVLVERARIDAGNEQLPHAAQPMRRHRMRAPVPAVEFGNNADPGSVRRPAGEAHALHALALFEPATQYAIGLLQTALVEQVKIIGSDGRHERIRIEGLEFPTGFADPQEHRVWRGIGPLPCKHALSVDAFHRRKPGFQTHGNARSVRPEYSQRPVPPDSVQAKQAERIVVAGGHQ